MTAGLIEQHASSRDKILDRMACDGWANKSDGMEPAPTGRFAIMSNADSELYELAQAFGESIPAGFDMAELLGHFIIASRDNSVVYVGQFDTRAQAEDEFEHLVARYDHWLAACPTCDGPRSDWELVEGLECHWCNKNSF